ncbi:uncharacterized protein H6S33_011865 [Morchella sextelata]|uniref:uncharacterized protein n=1 Tax=Morchella sextelata TaxID=1174677 RepID=UPI001D04841E|nr:uncharacterized protein H6S33_011865 [Morchella sextelata]KAH0610338.1 hypothetical protein H6S33_011865 [Morchella sextelata]
MSSRPLPSSFDESPDFYDESRWSKFSRRFKEEPLIPFGAALTCLALLQATRSIRAGNKAATNKWFRARIYAQGFTVAAMIAGSVYYKKERAEERAVEAIVAEKKGEEKRAAWIKELEIRDREDREMAERAKRHAERRRAAMAAAAATKDRE